MGCLCAVVFRVGLEVRVNAPPEQARNVTTCLLYVGRCLALALALNHLRLLHSNVIRPQECFGRLGTDRIPGLCTINAVQIRLVFLCVPSTAPWP